MSGSCLHLISAPGGLSLGSVLAPTVQTSSMAMILSGGTAAVSRGVQARNLHAIAKQRGALQKTHAALHFAPSRNRRRVRKRAGTNSGDSGSSGDEDEWFSGGGNDGGGSGSSGGSGGGRWGGSWGASGDAEHWLSNMQRQWELLMYEVGWVWLAVASLSMIQALHFVCCLIEGSAVKCSVEDHVTTA